MRPALNYVQEYIDKIKSGEIVVSSKVRKWYLNHIEPIIQGKHLKYYLNVKRGARVVEFIERFCRQSKGKWYGRPLKLQLFQKAKLQAIFGVLHRETKMRRFQEVFDVRARKNGKSTEMAAVANYLLVADKELGAEIYCAATTSAQALRVWEESRNMYLQSPELREFLTHKVFRQPTIECKHTMSKYQVLSRNVSSQDGLNASGAIVDEAHELGRDRYDILKQATTAREQPLLFIITTAGFVRGGLYDDLYRYAELVINGVVEDDTFFPLIYELDDPEEIWDEGCWVKANPGLDTIKDRDKLRKHVERMKGDPNFGNTVKTKDFNIIGVDNKAWLPFEVFNNNEVYSEDDLRKFDNSIVLGGFDLSRTNDLTAFNTLLFDREHRKIVAITMYWITAKFLEEQKKNNSKVPWQAWVDRGFIRISGTELIDYHDIANYVAANFKTYGWMYQCINYDSYSAQYLVKELASMGYSEKRVLIPTPQGYKTLSVPMQLLEAHLREKILVYQNNPVTKWCFSNVILKQDRNGNYMPDKSERDKKIDGVSAILNCYVSLSENIESYFYE